MPNQLGPIEICCDSPPYHIVRACRMIGYQTPEDVRWCRMSHFLQADAWKLLAVLNQPRGKNCTCRQKLPALEKYTFTLISDQEVSYFLGQCGLCRTVYWEEA